jgi:Fic family protein
VDAIRVFIKKSIGQPFRLRISDLLKLNRVAIEGLNPLAGVFRPDEMKISLSRHNPPPPELVPELTEAMCDYVNENPGKSPLHLSAYLLRRINWIHPIDDGNGRTARAVSYGVLCIKLGYELPGVRTIPEQISENKQPYYKALEAADEAYKSSRIDVAAVEEILEEKLLIQLVKLHEMAVGES